MTYRRPSEQPNAARAWSEFVATNRALIEAAGLPRSCTESQERFDDFLMHGHLDHHPDPVQFNVDALTGGQYAELTRLVEVYFAADRDWFTPLALRVPDQQRLRSRFDRGARR